MIKDFLLTLGVILGIDVVWLGVVAKNFYAKQLGGFERTVRWPAVGLVYLVLALGLVFLVLPKAGGNAKSALLWGGFYGLVVYGVYDLTNMATLKNWTLTMVVVDMLWGSILCGITSYLVTKL